MKSLKKQQGASLSTMLFVIFTLLVFGRIGFAIVPMYWQDHMIGEMLQKMEESEEITEKMRPKQITGLIQERMRKTGLNASIDSLEIKKTKRGMELDWPYEKNERLYNNISISLTFHQQAEF